MHHHSSISQVVSQIGKLSPESAEEWFGSNRTQGDRFPSSDRRSVRGQTVLQVMIIRAPTQAAVGVQLKTLPSAVESHREVMADFFGGMPSQPPSRFVQASRNPVVKRLVRSSLAVATSAYPR